MKHKKIVIVATGGTIAGTGKPGKTINYQAGDICVDEIMQSIPMIDQLADLETIQLMNVDSNEMNEQRWILLANTLNEIASREDVDGMVVTHGTDTLDETAYFLNLVCHTNKPIVITGAMRPATATSADGPFNLYQAICLALNESAYGQGVLCIFSNTIYSSRDVQKINNLKIDAFGQKTFGCLGFMRDEVAYFYTKSNKLHTAQSIFSLNALNTFPKVAIAYYYAGADVELLEFLAKKHQGIVVVGTGSGNYSMEWLKKMQELSEQGTVFVRTSRVSDGIVFEDPIFDPNNQWIPANTLSCQKARILLMLALSMTTDINRIKNIFKQY